MAKLGILILGQTPRADMEELFGEYIPSAELLQAGGLDGLTIEEIDALVTDDPEYPLFVILADGSTREIAMGTLIPLLEKKAKALAASGAEAIVLMCAGNFPLLDSPVPVIYPGKVVPAVVEGISSQKRIAIVTPNAGQLEPALNNWRQRGFSVYGTCAAPIDDEALKVAADTLRQPGLDLVVLDCMGFAPKAVGIFREVFDLPVVCPRRLVARITAEMLGC